MTNALTDKLREQERGEDAGTVDEKETTKKLKNKL